MLIYYIVARNCEERLWRTIRFQRRVLPQWDAIPKVFIVEHGVRTGVPGVPTVRLELFDQDGLFLFSKAKNAAIDYAVRHEEDWLLDCDADTAILKLPQQMPWTGYGCMRIHFAKEEETQADVLSMRDKGRLNLQGSSRFLTRRDVFTKHRYHEGFAGYGGEDLDYHETVLATNGVHQSPTDAIGVHFWHPMKNRPMNDPTLRQLRKRAHGSK